jgi:phospholipase C
MAFQLSHTLVSKRFEPQVEISDANPEEITLSVKQQGEFAVLVPGPLTLAPSATYLVRERTPPDGSEPIDGELDSPGTTPLHGGFRNVRKNIPVKLRVFTPDGQEFTAPQITLADLRKFQDLRGAPTGPWRYSLVGQKTHVFIEPDETLLGEAKGGVTISVLETVPSLSAPPLVPATPVGRTSKSFAFDLYRVGEFVAELHTGLGRWAGSMRLVDPDGVVVAQTTAPPLRAAISLPMLNKSRDAAGRVRNWQLEVLPQRGAAGQLSVSATVVGRGQITIPTLMERVNALLGPRGSFIKLFGENKNGNALARLKVTDIASAETIDMHGLLDKRLESVGQDSGVDFRNFNAGTVYSLAKKQDVESGVKIDVGTLKVETMDVTIGPGVLLGASVPAIRLALAVSGEVLAKLGPLTLATANVRGAKLDMEVGLTLLPDGTPQIVSMVSDSPFAINVGTATLVVTALVGLGLTAEVLVKIIEHYVNEAIVSGARTLFTSPTLAPSILMRLFGAHLNYRSIRIENGAILFDFVAPIEPEPKPGPNYSGAIGREPMILSAAGSPRFMPLLGDTWKADNLAAKIDHVVVVMMENRSYDHVLGYRAQPPFNDGADGLTQAMVDKINAAPEGPFAIRAMREAAFKSNDFGLKTRLPKSVGHETHDVKQQLEKKTAGPEGHPTINSPKGFIENFEPRLVLKPGETPHNVVPNDVLGYYEPLDLPFYGYLAEHYAYCDRYYCAHPGPTLPNRMYSLTGDLQHDRYGFPIVDNNTGDNFLLSRTPTLYDMLTRKGISWRVYESAPSITMLRMFARYATNNTDIVPLGPVNDPFAQLRADVANNRLPAYTAIEPAMHHHPQNDDHPDADMYRGQIFLQGVYNTLRSNPEVWKKTLLIITYDEHGGLYDHVVPPLADFYNVSIAESATSTDGGVGSSSEQPRDVVMSGEMSTSASENPNPPPAPPLAATAPLRVSYGIRVPTFVVSPWTKPGKGPSITLDHCSILKTVLARFIGAEKPFMSDRVTASQTFNAFLTEPAARMDVPNPPELQTSFAPDSRRVAPGASAIITPLLSRQEMRNGPVDYHALSGRLARMLGR